MKIILFLLLVLTFGSCKDAPQVSVVKNENYKLRQAIDLGEVTPLGVAKFKHYLFVSDTINEKLLQYNMEAKEMDTVYTGKVGYVACEKARTIFLDFKTNSLLLYRGEPQLSNLKVDVDLVKPMSFSGTRVDDFYLIDQDLNALIRNDRGDFSVIGEVGSSDTFSAPSMVVLNRNQVLVSDTGNKRIKVYDTNLNLQFSFGEDLLERPTAISTNGELIFVCDTEKKEILIFNNKGEYQFSFDSGLTEPTAVFSEGNLLVVSDIAKDEIKLFDRVFPTDQ